MSHQVTICITMRSPDYAVLLLILTLLVVGALLVWRLLVDLRTQGQRPVAPTLDADAMLASLRQTQQALAELETITRADHRERVARLGLEAEVRGRAFGLWSPPDPPPPADPHA